MTPLGKPLVFYLKYMAERDRLYCDLEEGKERDLTGLDAAEHILEMARPVGDAACEQVADFLALCGKGIEDHFTGLGITTLAKKRTRAFVKNNWFWGARVCVSTVVDGWFYCGVWVTAPPVVRISLAKDVCGLAVPYLWSKGGRKGADGVWKILGSWAHSRAGEGLFDDKGTVALACIPVKAQPPESFDVDREDLVAEVIKAFARIGAEQTKAIASFAAGLNEPDES